MKEIIEGLKNTYPEVFPIHQMKPLLHHVASAGSNPDTHYVHAHIESDFFNLIIEENRALQFSNTFMYRNIMDIIYFILNVFKNTGLTKDNPVVLSGQTEMFDELYSNMRAYVREIKFAEPIGNYTFSYVFNDLQLHKYLNLFTAISCA